MNNHTDPRQLYQEAVAAYRSNRFLEAVSKLESVLKAYPDFEDAKNDLEKCKQMLLLPDIQYKTGRQIRFLNTRRYYFEKETNPEALQWYIKAALQGHAKAQYALGKSFSKKILKKDKIKAVKWFHLAAKSGLAKAQYALAECYFKGRGAEKDLEKAVKWFRKAAMQGHVKAQFELAKCYRFGCGIEQNNAKAAKWYRKLANSGHTSAYLPLALCTDNEEESFKWHYAAVKEGYLDAYFYLAKCYQEGRGVEQNDQKAFTWFRKSANAGDVDSQYELAECYLHGKGVEKDVEKARKWHRKSAEERESYQYNPLEESSQKEKERFKWYSAAAEEGNPDSFLPLAHCYYYGIGVKKDVEKATKYFRFAANCGFDAAIEKLKEIEGTGKEK